MDRAHWVQATDLLIDPGKLGEAKKTVVIGGGVVGCETAYWLKYEKGCDVTVVEMLPYIMSGACTANRYHLIHYMEKAGVRLLNCAKVTGFTGSGVQIEKTYQKAYRTHTIPGSPSSPRILPIHWLKRSAGDGGEGACR